MNSYIYSYWHDPLKNGSKLFCQGCIMAKNMYEAFDKVKQFSQSDNNVSGISVVSANP